ncbi:hypothetical protein GCM10026982_60570 [Nocardiopsis aegyptia]
MREGCGVTAQWSVNGWAEDGNSDFDYAALQLNCRLSVGYFGMITQPGSYDGRWFSIYGYPTIKRPLYSMWWHHERVSDTKPHTVEYAIDTSPGQSGAPVFQPLGHAYSAIAIHTTGSARVGGHNSGAKITPPRLENFASWRTPTP